jgi:hypothetical protein
VQPLAQRLGAMLWVSREAGIPTVSAAPAEGGAMDSLSRAQRRSFQARLVPMPNPVHLLVFTRRDGRREIAARQLGRELRALSRDVHLELHDVDANPLLAARYGIDATPAFALLTGGVIIEDARIRFYGLPEGPVLEGLVDGIVAVGQGTAAVATADDRRVRRLARPLHLDLYAPRPAAVDRRALLRLQRLALVGAQLSLDIVSGEDAPAWARHADGAGTALIVVNDTSVVRGGGGAELLDALEAATWGEPERLDLECPGRAFRGGEHRLGAPTVAAPVAAVLTGR